VGGHISCTNGIRVMKSPILGIRHITAIAGDPQSNIAFCTGVLGPRLATLPHVG